MQEKFKNKYKIKSARLEGYDYSQNGMYFVTICTKNREEFFGDILDGEMQLSQIGKIAEECWKEIPNHFPFVVLDEFIVMPSHIHGIIEIYQNTCRDEALPRLYTGHNVKMSKISPKSGSLSVIMGSFKSIVSRNTHKNIGCYFAWQPRFYDHIIRNDESLHKIQEYIKINPKTWHRDKNNAENVFM